MIDRIESLCKNYKKKFNTIIETGTLFGEGFQQEYLKKLLVVEYKQEHEELVVYNQCLNYLT